MMNMENTTMGWIAAEYHFPSTYSCRFPMSSLSSAQIIPTPGPATVRLALIRTGIEAFGISQVCDELFPTIRAATIAIQPPLHIGISTHNLRAYKAATENAISDAYIGETLIYREFAQAMDPMTIYLQMPITAIDTISVLLANIGYWGQENSLAQCITVKMAEPMLNECMMPLHSLSEQVPAKHLVTGFVTEFRDTSVSWEEIILGQQEKVNDAIRIELYVWPMQVIAQHGTSRLLLRCPISEVYGA
jgi:hypothetical protein